MSSALPPDPADPPVPGAAAGEVAARRWRGWSDSLGGRFAASRFGLASRLIIASVAFVILVASGYAWALFRNFTESVPHGDAVPASAAGQTDLDGSAQDILLIGNDSRVGATPAELSALHTGHDLQTVNTDTMMILHIPSTVGSKPSIISLPRDAWVSIPGYGKGKLNSAFSAAYNAAKSHHRTETQAQSAGILLTLRTLSDLTGLRIDHYLQVNLLGFYRISEAIGGVQVCLLHAQNAKTDSDAFGSGYSGIDLPAGVSTIEGKQALAFVRQRHGLPHGDLDRIKRQQYFLAAAFHKIASAGTMLNPFKLHHLLDAVSSSLLTDPALNLLSLARSFELLSGGDISFATLPNNGPQVIYPDGVETAIVQVDHAAIPSFIQSVIGQHTDLSKVQPAQRSKVTLNVLNGADVYRLATRNAAQLKRLGFKTDVVDSTPSPVTATSIQYPPGHAAGAKALAAVVTGAKLVETSSVARVTLTLGTDGKQVQGLTSRANSAPKTATPAKKPASSTAANGLGCIN
jgi:LCP family protein required for cell wall assembly